MRRLAPILAVLTLAAPSARAAIVPDGFVDEPVVSGFALPRAFAFLPDGRLLVLEQATGKIRLVVGGHIASTDPVATIAGVDAAGTEGGAQGIAIDPAWPARPYVYVFYDAFTHRNVLARYTATGALSDPAGETLALGTPMVLIGDIVNNAQNHNAGCLRFGLDGHLYVALGEDATFCMAQDSTGLRGQILRLRTDALPPGDNGGVAVPRAWILPTANPLSSPDSNAKLVYAYGLRNPWIFAVDRSTGNLHVADVGESSEEEIDEIVPGGNYGWPYREGKHTVLARSSCPEPGGTGNPANGYRAPIWAYDHVGTQAIYTSGVYRRPPGGAADWPAAYDGSLFYGNYYVGDLFRIVRDGGTGTWGPAAAVPGQTGAAWGTGFLYAADFAIAADGSLWWLQQSSTGNFTPTDGMLRRVRWAGNSSVFPDGAPGLRLGVGANPFAGATTFTISLPETAHARLTIHDLAGRRLVTLIDGLAPAGSTPVPWDGRDERGRAVRAGVYVARLESGGATRQVRVTRAP